MSTSRVVDSSGAHTTVRSDGVSLVPASSQKHLGTIWGALFIFAGYYFGSKIGFALTFQPYPVSTLWPPNAMMLAALLLSPTRIWPVLILAAFPAHLAIQLESDVPPLMVLCWFVSNTSEALIGAGLVRKFLTNPVRFDVLREFNLFFLFVAFAAPFFSSFIDSAFVRWNDWGSQTYWQLWRMRFFSNVLAGLTLVPVILTWSRTNIAAIRSVPLKNYAEAVLLIVALTAVTFAVFNSPTDSGHPGWIYLPLPFLLWAAVRFGLNVLSTSILIVALVAIWGSIHGRGPFHVTNPIDNAFYIQMFVIVFSYPILLFTSILMERKKIRETALQNEERFRLALSAAKMSTWDLQLPIPQIVSSADYKQLVSRHLKGDYLNLGSSIHREDRLKVSEAISHATANGGTFEVEFRSVRPNGELMWLLGKGEVLTEDGGRTLRVLGVNVDITERKRAEEERRRAEVVARQQRQELFHLSRVGMLGELSGTVAHELNQPLTAILSNAQAAQRFLMKETFDVKELRQIVNDVIDQDRRASDVIKRMRALLRKEDVERKPLNINDIVKESLGLAHSELVTHNIRVDTEFCGDLPMLSGDRVQLQQVFLNLVMNAVEALMTVDSSFRSLKITTSMSSDSIQLTVSDTGTGIPDDMLHQVFDPFHTTKPHGLGLGLAISRTIIVAHGGQIRVINNPDRGATFLLTLPVG